MNGPCKFKEQLTHANILKNVYNLHDTMQSMHKKNIMYE